MRALATLKPLIFISVETAVVNGETTIAMLAGASMMYGAVIAAPLSVAVVGTLARTCRAAKSTLAGTVRLYAPLLPEMALGSPVSHTLLLLRSKQTVAPMM